MTSVGAAAAIRLLQFIPAPANGPAPTPPAGSLIGQVKRWWVNLPNDEQRSHQYSGDHYYVLVEEVFAVACTSVPARTVTNGNRTNIMTMRCLPHHLGFPGRVHHDNQNGTTFVLFGCVEPSQNAEPHPTYPGFDFFRCYPGQVRELCEKMNLFISVWYNVVNLLRDVQNPHAVAELSPALQRAAIAAVRPARSVLTDEFTEPVGSHRFKYFGHIHEHGTNRSRFAIISPPILTHRHDIILIVPVIDDDENYDNENFYHVHCGDGLNIFDFGSMRTIDVRYVRRLTARPIPLTPWELKMLAGWLTNYFQFYVEYLDWQTRQPAVVVAGAPTLAVVPAPAPAPVTATAAPAPARIVATVGAVAVALPAPPPVSRTAALSLASSASLVPPTPTA